MPNTAWVGRLRSLATAGRRVRDAAMPRPRPGCITKNGAVTLLDIRPEDAFVQGHLPGAISMPLDVPSCRLADLPRGREIIAYCRGPSCILSFEAVAALRAGGLKARRFDGGFPSRTDAGPAVDTGA